MIPIALDSHLLLEQQGRLLSGKLPAIEYLIYLHYDDFHRLFLIA
ncbi:hypothetical protein SAMN05216412_101169 [Nitrosospira multiformis]|uniref:Uncharacterized protein n=1 Tax=Nitrosospira multiformis TaxID=1231 RepID=A0A1H9YDB9_9PROT|nr:hypothetical protein SAMN05216412_101169 [Nitrosospira multiformis]